MQLADHIRPLLREHDCVIIPDFGGLVANASSARAQPGRQALSPPTKLVAFNQALTRNDGLLVDALSQRLGLPIAQAREALRSAVALLQQELDKTNRTELPGIGIFRRAAGRGLAFEYTGHDNLLASAFGLPELAARPVRANDARPKRLQPVLRGTGTRRTRWARLLPGGAIAIAAALLLLANFQVALNAGYLPSGWKTQLPNWEWAQRQSTPTTLVSEPQQATLGQHDFSSNSIATEGMTPLKPVASAVAMPAPVPVVESQPAAVLAEEVIITPKIKVVAPAPAKAVVVAVPAPIVVAPKVAPAVVAPARVHALAAVSSTSSTTIKIRTGRYYVIAGAYGSLANAEKGRLVLVRTGHAARIILPPFGSRFFRLTAADYPDLASAQREALRLRISTHCDYNTLKF